MNSTVRKNSIGPRLFEGMGRRDFLRSVLAGSAVSLAALDRLNAAVYETIASLNETLAGDESPDGAYWEALKKHFLFEDGVIMMNNGTVGPMPEPVFNTLIKTFRLQVTNPFDVYNYLPAFKEAVRAKLAAFINASPDEVAFTSNTTEGINLIVNGLDLKPGDEVLVSDMEHPGNLNPWRLKAKRFGVVIKEVPHGLPPKNAGEIVEAFAAAASPRTRVISLGHTVYLTGLITPLKEMSRMAHDKGILLLADSAHGLGMINLDMKELGVDFFASSPYKWLGAPTGVGLLYVRKEAQEKVWPTIVSGGWDTTQGARKLDPQGQRADALLFALDEAMNFQNRIGRERIERRIKALAAYLRAGLKKIPGVKLHTPDDPALSAGLTQFGLEGVEASRLVDIMREKHNLVIRTTGSREKGTYGIRVSTPIYISHREVDLVLDGVREIMGRPSASRS